jgi:glycerol-3-phosphate dehydrogenase (NAD(P)+)
MAEGLGLGDNSKASVITRGLAEISRLGEALGADPVTFSGLAGVGDLIATCMSPLSRNHTFGVNLGRGMSVDEVVAITRQTAEGVKSCQSILDLALANAVDMPIVQAMVAVVHHGAAPRDIARRLLSRARKAEQD